MSARQAKVAPRRESRIRTVLPTTDVPAPVTLPEHGTERGADLTGVPVTSAQSPTAAAPTTRTRAVSRPQDAVEQQADRAAAIVMRGGRIARGSLGRVRSDPTVIQRQTSGDQPTAPAADTTASGSAASRALSKVVDAAGETEAVRELKRRVLDDPLVKAVKDAVSTPAGIAALVGAGAVGVGALAAGGRELPVQPPSLSLDSVLPGLSAQIVYRGPVNRPTEVSLALTFKPVRHRGQSTQDAYRAETARLAADQLRFRAGLRYPPGSQEAKDQHAVDEAAAQWLAGHSSLPGLGVPLIPLTPGGPTTGPPATAPGDHSSAPADSGPPRDEQPVLRSAAPTSALAGGARPSAVDGQVAAVAPESALRGAGQPLTSAIRAPFETSFGYDFSDVRVHTGATADDAARRLGAEAFTLGSDIAFAQGRFDPTSPVGTHLLAHELAHVVQAGGQAGQGTAIHRFASYSQASQTDGRSAGWRHPTTDSLRVSDDGQMAAEDRGWGQHTNKRAWTTPALVATSNGVLAAQQSLANLRPKPGGQAISGSAPATGTASNLVEIEPFKPAGGGPLDLASDCGSAARQVMGSGPAGKDVAVISHPAEKADDGTTGAIAGGIIGALGGAGVGALIGMSAGPLGALVGGLLGGAAGLIGGIFAGRALGRHDASPAREDFLTPRDYHGGNPTTPEEWSEELFRSEFGSSTREEAYAAYARLSPADRDDFDRRHGINRYARPRIGQGLTVSTEKDMPGFSSGGVRTWNFHYAATVLSSGPDYVTLENAAGWRPDDWIFYMYGTALGQSFDEQQGATRTHGNLHTSFVVEPERSLDVTTRLPTTTLTTRAGSVVLTANTALRLLERRPTAVGPVELRVRVVGGPHDGVEGMVSEADIR